MKDIGDRLHAVVKNPPITTRKSKVEVKRRVVDEGFDAK